MKGCKSVLSKILGIFGAAFLLLIIWGMFSEDSDDVVEVMKENEKDFIEENEYKENDPVEEDLQLR